MDEEYKMGDAVLGRTTQEKDTDKLKRIQRRATKMIPELRDLSYESRYYNVV